MGALLQADEEDNVPITEDELRCALITSKVSAPGEEGITYSILRPLQNISGNPILQLNTLCLQKGCIPHCTHPFPAPHASAGCLDTS